MATTRAPRPGEKDGQDFYFVREEKFKQALENNEVLAWSRDEAPPHAYKGILSSKIHERQQEGRLFYLDVGGQITRQLPHYQEMRDALFVFLLPPSFEELIRRITSRTYEEQEAQKAGTKTLSPEEIESRLKAAANRLETTAPAIDIYIVNDRLEDIPDKVSLVTSLLKPRVS